MIDLLSPSPSWLDLSFVKDPNAASQPVVPRQQYGYADKLWNYLWWTVGATFSLDECPLSCPSAGGCDFANAFLFGDVRVFDVRLLQWSNVTTYGQKPTPRCAPTLTLLENKVCTVVAIDLFIVASGLLHRRPDPQHAE